MPRLMEKKDWSRTVSEFGNLGRVWQEDLTGDSNVVSLSLPEVGSYRVFLVKINDEEPVDDPVSRVMGCIKTDRTSDELVRELRGV